MKVSGSPPNLFFHLKCSTDGAMPLAILERRIEARTAARMSG